MGTYYHGDIDGKFWVGVQSSTDAEFFGVEGNANFLHYYFDEDNKKALQTHTAYPDDEGFYIFAHPFDFMFAPESVQGW